MGQLERIISHTTEMTVEHLGQKSSLLCGILHKGSDGTILLISGKTDLAPNETPYLLIVEPPIANPQGNSLDYKVLSDHVGQEVTISIRHNDRPSIKNNYCQASLAVEDSNGNLQVFNLLK